jgi:hypothetical protein
VRGSRLLGLLAVAVACAPPPPPPPQPELAPLLARIERACGRRFVGPVSVRAIAPDAVPGRLERELDRVVPPEELARTQRLLHALGLLPADVDLRRALLDFQSQAVAGFYTALDGVLYVVADPGLGPEALAREPGTALVVTHELVHALQGMHSRVPDVTLGLADDDDVAFALGALLEGDATVCALQDAARAAGAPLPDAADVRAEIAALVAESERRGTPRLVREVLLVPYAAGTALVEDVLARGGSAALEAAFADPPLSSEEILHPERYLDERRPAAWLAHEPAPLAPHPACREVARSRFGEIGLRVFAAEAGAPEAEARAAADGWDGDAAWLLDCPDGEAFAWWIQLDAPDQAGELAEVARSRHWPGASRALRAPPRIDASGSRVLFSAGLGEGARRALLEAPSVRRHPNLEAYLAARPEVLERTRELRAGVALEPGGAPRGR